MKRLFGLILIITVILLAIIPLSCQQKPALETGWTLHEEPEEGWEIALPDTWRVMTGEKEMPDGEITLLFYAVDPASNTVVLDYGGSFSIMQVNLPFEVSLAELGEKLVSDLESDPTTVKPVTTKQVVLLAGEAMECTYAKDYPHRTGHVVFIQYAIIKDNKLYVLTSETTPDLIEKYRPIYEKIAHSFRFLE